MRTETYDDWQKRRAPDLAVFEALARRGYAELPAEFRRLTGDIEIRVAEFADEEALDDLGIEDPFELMGLFVGVGLAHDEAAGGSGRLPNRIWLYRRAILDYWAEHDESLGDIVTHVLIHEIGHHFGLSDEDMEDIEASAG
ncbi:metallopeptidase family protein [Methylobrevis pamukkalensis]|uniref:Possibl zinc metallo-peptidase n=1 Tax=Methylobrevis pamukkalensis TaxID=1439726 RepID=A0A1E3H1S5_9HYPH|nr:metallopeptidase family protein [Methylobrevis pamukkalensis]ODN70288.1 Possibl zinc metallo-peptidase [Methylobrevis pamukkalensis]